MNKSDIKRNYFMLQGSLAKCGYDWWWHSFTGHDKKTGEAKTFYIEYFLCNPKISPDKVSIVWNDENARKQGKRPSYMMVNVGYW